MRPTHASRHLLHPLVLSSLVFILASPTPGGAATGAAGWIAGAVPLPAVNASDVTVAGSSFVVGLGAFGAGLQSIARIDRDGTATTLVTGLNSIGGIAYDRAGDRLLFTDNGLTAPPGTAVTGDTVYALADPLGATSPVAASTLELAPSGSIAFAQAVLPLAGGDVLVGDAAGLAVGRVVKLSGGNLSNLITGLDYTAGLGLAVTPAGELLVGDVDANTFAGSVDRYSLAGAFLGTLAAGLSGAYDQEVDRAGNLILTGGFRDDFSSSNVVSIAPGGAISEIGWGFDFSSGLAIDPQSQQVLVLDFGTSRIDTLTPVTALTPGGTTRGDCRAELWGGTFDTRPNGKPSTRWTCTDGDACDRDGAADGACTFVVGSCFSVTDARLPACTPGGVDQAEIKIAKSPPPLAALQAAADAILPSSAAVCSSGVEVVVAARRSMHVTVRAKAAGRTVDSDNLTLRCRAGV